MNNNLVKNLFVLLAQLFHPATLVLTLGLMAQSHPELAVQAAKVDRNVIYGTYSGLALVFDAYYPEQSNGCGVILIPGTGWTLDEGYDAPTQKDARPGQLMAMGKPLLASGYTIFVLSHRATPRFAHPAAITDVRRAIAFVRRNADQFKINGRCIGGIGFSSGAHLLALAATMATDEEGGLQAVVAIGGYYDLLLTPNQRVAALTTSFIGTPILKDEDKSTDLGARLAEASPLHRLPPKPKVPFLLIHSDADEVLPSAQSSAFAEKIKTTGGDVLFIQLHGFSHAESVTKGIPTVEARLQAWLRYKLPPTK